MNFLRHFLFLLMAVTMVRGATLREQLTKAEKAEDSCAQIELIRRILDQEPGDAELKGQLAALWLEVKDYNMAEGLINAWKDAPENVRASVTATVLFERDDKKAEAAKVLQDYLAKTPGNLGVTRQLAIYLNAQDRYQDIVTLLDKAPGVSKDSDLLVARALARHHLHDFDGALRDFAAAENNNKEDSSVTGNRNAFEKLQTAQDGIKACQIALAVDPANFAALVSRAYWYLYTSYAAELALADAKASQKVCPNAVTPLLLSAWAENSLGQLTVEKARTKYDVDVSKPTPSIKALELLLQADVLLAKNAKDTKAWQTRCFTLNDEPQQYLLAIKDAEAWLALDPKASDARLEKIYALVKLGKTSEAGAELRPFEAAKPPPEKMATALSYLVETTFAASQLDTALAYANRAIKLNPAAQYYKQRAAILQRLDRGAEARADLAEAERLQKGSKR